MKVFWIFLFWSFHLAGSNVSVIVPCYYGHFHLLPNLLQELNKQTELPSEVVISLSEVDRLTQEEVSAFITYTQTFPFQIQLLCSPRKQLAGENRMLAAHQAMGEILICQDADDLPHPQRIEIIHKLFDQQGIDHLVHRWVENTTAWEPYEITRISTQHIKNAKHFETFTNAHFGNCAIRKKVLQKVQWSPRRVTGEDRLFCYQCVYRFKNTLLVDAALLEYRIPLSSHNDGRQGVATMTFSGYSPSSPPGT